MRGKTSVIILYTLKSENRYGLQIIKEIKSLTNGKIDIKLPSLYNTLHKLESDGYITSYWENSEIGGKRRYSALTDKGRKYLDEHPVDFSEYENQVKTPASNTPSSLAIQPDFFNTIAHSERQEKLQNEQAEQPIPNEEEIHNYSILDYIESENERKSITQEGVSSPTPAFETHNSLSANTSIVAAANDESSTAHNALFKNNSLHDASTQAQETVLQATEPSTENASAENDFGFEHLELENSAPVYERVYDKNDAVLLSDNEIIPQNEGLSLLYKPTTITNDKLCETEVDFDGIFGDMIERDVAKTTLFGSPTLNVDDHNEDDNSSPKKIDIFDKYNSIKERLENEQPDNKPKINILENPYQPAAQEQEDVSHNGKISLFENSDKPQDVGKTAKTIETPVQSGQVLPIQEAFSAEIKPPKRNINEYLMRDKVIVEDKYKANIFLKKSNFSNTEYDFFSAPPKYDKNTLAEIEQPQNKKLDIFFNNPPQDDYVEPYTKTLDEFIDDCEENGIYVTVYNSTCRSRVRSNNVHANRSNLLTSIISFGALTIALIAMFFAFKTDESVKPLSIMVISIFAISILYPIVCALFLVKNDRVGIPVCNIKKEWIPRSIIVISIILLTLAVNILSGMNANNFEKYAPYIVVPIASSFVIIFDYFVKAIIFKVKLFRE